MNVYTVPVFASLNISAHNRAHAHEVLAFLSAHGEINLMLNKSALGGTIMAQVTVDVASVPQLELVFAE